MRVTVVICTYNRLGSLRNTLNALGRQSFRDFEVVVVNGPSTDGTGEFLARQEGLRALDNPERNVSRSRNLGVAVAAGEVVAFIDDDAVPMARWLEELTAPFADPAVGATGGLVLDNTGVRLQWRYLVCARNGETDFDQEPPLDRFSGPAADPFLYLVGCNTAYRRTALQQVGGFDEEIEIYYDETEACLQLHDAGWRLEALDGATVHHQFLPSHLRSETAFTDPFFEVKNRTYFALRHGRATRLTADVLTSLNQHFGHLRASARDAARHGRLDEAGLRHYLGRADAAYHVGLRAGMDGERRSVAVPEGSGFLRYPTIEYRGTVGVREDAAEARRLAEEGHEVHLLVPGGPDEAYRVDYDDGVWVRTVPVRERWTPGQDIDPREAALQAAEIHAGVREGELDDRFPVDWELEARACLGIEDDDAFVRCLYERLFGRQADDLGRRLALLDLQAGKVRNELVARMASSVEGRGRGITPEFLERLPVVPRARAEVLVRGIWMLDDAGFGRELSELLLGEETPFAGGDRHAHFTALAARPAALNRIAGLEHLPPPDVKDPTTLESELAAVATADTQPFADAVYRALLDRPVDEAGHWSVVEALRDGATRREVIASVAESEEARVRGVRPDGVRALLAGSGAYKRAELRGRVSSVLRRVRPSSASGG